MVGLQTSHRKMEEGSVNAREATHLVIMTGFYSRHNGTVGYCFAFGRSFVCAGGSSIRQSAVSGMGSLPQPKAA